MEQQKGSANISVTWRGNKFDLEMDLTATLKDLGSKLQKLTDVKADTLRLIVPQAYGKSTKLLYPFSDEHSSLSLQETSILEGKSIRMMGVPRDEVDELLHNAETNLRIAGFEEEEQRLRQRMSYSPNISLKLPQGQYIFCNFRTLHIPGLELNPPASEALKRMHMLAADPGIVSIMNKHRWRVGIMTEMAPEGYVGVSSECILGFNKNHGEEISLRLRTDDLKGFRKYESIKKTLLHELAHMVYSDHDANFKALDSQLNQEAAALDWTKSRSHTLSGTRYSDNYEDLLADNHISSSHRLGGTKPDRFTNARTTSVAAAYQRLANNSSTDPENSMPSQESEPMDVVEEVKVDIKVPDEPDFGNFQPDPEKEVLSLEDQEDPQIEALENKMQPTETDKASDIDDLEENRVVKAEHNSINISAIDVYEPDPDDEEIRRIQDSVSVICNRLQKAIELLKSEANPSEASSVLQTLSKIIRNVIEHPNEMKFKKIRKANPVIQRNVTNYKAAMEILSLIGFSEDNVSDGTGKLETFLVLKRNDPGLLWLAKSSLETRIG